MEVFTGDHTDVVLFSDTHFSPYSLPTSDSFSDHHKISISTDHFQPPQKLRPIRCSNNNVRSFSDRCGSDDPVDAKPLSWHPEAGVYNGEINTCSNLGLPVAECQIEAAISPCSSDETIKLQNQPIKEPINKKMRKRKSRKKMEFYFERMVQTVMEKQEQMHKQLIDMLEQNEKESIIREQAWKKHETERAKRDEQARKQQVSQCQALLSFIQKTLGQEIQIANHPDTNLESQEKSKYDDDDILMKNIEESEGDPNGRRWPKSEVQALITVRVALNHMFENGKGPKGSIWDEVAATLSGMGYYRTPKKCKEKWENINKYYRRTMEKGKATSKSCSYFKELEMLHKNGFSSAICHDEDQSNEGFVSAISHDEDQRNAVMIVPNGEGEGNK